MVQICLMLRNPVKGNFPFKTYKGVTPQNGYRFRGVNFLFITLEVYW